MSSNPALDKIKAAGGIETPKNARQKNRTGMKGLLTHHSPAVVKQLKIIGAEQDKNQQQLIGEALNMLFARYGKQQIA